MIVHITLTSGFFHGMNELRPAAIQQDVRNAQWYADGWIGEPASLAGPQIRRNAQFLPGTSGLPRLAMQNTCAPEWKKACVWSVRRLAARMAEHPETLLTISGDGEVELNFERNISGRRTRRCRQSADLMPTTVPFMVEEFRDWIQHSRYEGDKSPDTG